MNMISSTRLLFSCETTYKLSCSGPDNIYRENNLTYQTGSLLTDGGSVGISQNVILLDAKKDSHNLINMRFIPEGFLPCCRWLMLKLNLHLMPLAVSAIGSLIFALSNKQGFYN